MSEPSWGQIVRTPGFTVAALRCVPWLVPVLVLMPFYLAARGVGWLFWQAPRRWWARNYSGLWNTPPDDPFFE